MCMTNFLTVHMFMEVATSSLKFFQDCMHDVVENVLKGCVIKCMGILHVFLILV